MSSHDFTIAGYVLMAAIGTGIQLLAYVGRTPIPTLGALLGRVMRTRSGRVGVVTGWAWLGMHFFVR